MRKKIAIKNKKKDLFFKSFFVARLVLKWRCRLGHKGEAISVYTYDRTGTVTKVKHYILTEPRRLIPSWAYLGWIDDLLGMLTCRRVVVDKM